MGTPSRTYHHPCRGPYGGRTARALAGGLALLLPLLGLSGTATAATAPAATASAAAADEPSGAARGQLVRERVYVETEVDTDHDGQPDRVALDIARPAGNEPVPVVFEQSPYRFGTSPVDFHNVNVDHLPQADLFAGEQRPFADAHGSRGRVRTPGLPGWYDDYFLPRGYAVVLGHSIGTGDSDGCPTSGGMSETRGVTAVIDWLNGRATAYDGSGQPVEADWSDGRVGMLGVSYNGTLANMAATTGVEGLEATVPISAISSWYGYYRANGLVVAPGGYQGEDVDVLAEAVVGNPGCEDEIADLAARMDRESGDYSEFWKKRDYLRRAGNVTAAVFVMHGHSDWNVKGQQYARWWKALERHDVPRKIWLHNGGHGPPGRADYRETIGRWFDEHVKGLDTGIMDEPRAAVQLGDGTWHTYADWPVPAARKTEFQLSADSPTAPGGLSTETASETVSKPATGHVVRQDFTDEGRQRDAASLAAHPDRPDNARLVYRTDPLEHAQRLSGTAEVTLRVAVENRDAANLTALLVDYGAPGSTADPVIVTRGWLDPQNRNGRATSEPLVRGQEYELTFAMQPKDHVFEAGRRIGLVVISTDHDFTLRPRPGTRLRVTPARSTLTLPLLPAGEGNETKIGPNNSGHNVD